MRDEQRKLRPCYQRLEPALMRSGPPGNPPVLAVKDDFRLPVLHLDFAIYLSGRVDEHETLSIDFSGSGTIMRPNRWRGLKLCHQQSGRKERLRNEAASKPGCYGKERGGRSEQAHVLIRYQNEAEPETCKIFWHCAAMRIAVRLACSGMSADLSLVTECLRGDVLAWEKFLLRYRGPVFGFALSLTREETAAQEIASAIWADLYGVNTDSTGTRVSKLAGYSGRGSLEGWLRTLVAQAYVDRFRKERRFVSIEHEQAGWNRQAQSTIEPADIRLEHALDKALSELSGEERLVLSAHYLDGRTFAEIGRMMGAHESSVSRQSKKSLDFLRKRTARHLRASGMSLQEAQETMGSDVRGISLDLRKRLQLAKNTP